MKAGAGRIAPTDGERWVQDALAELRTERFVPRAFLRFLAESEQRARQTRRERTELVRQARVWSLIGALAWIAGAAAGCGNLRRALAPGLAWWTATSLMLDRHLGMLETETGEPRPLQAADALTLARAWMVPLAAHRLTAPVCAAAYATDALDGVLARAAAPTRAGRDFDPIVDAIFATASLWSAARDSRLSRFAVAIEAVRIAAAAGYVSGHYLRVGTAPAPRFAAASRPATPLRAAGLLAASLGCRRTASGLVAAAAAIAAARIVRVMSPPAATRAAVRPG